MINIDMDPHPRHKIQHSKSLSIINESGKRKGEFKNTWKQENGLQTPRVRSEPTTSELKQRYALVYESEEEKLTPESEVIAKLSFMNPTYWTVKVDKIGNTSLTSFEIKAYRYLKNYHPELNSPDFEDYRLSIENSCIVKRVFEENNIDVELYPGRRNDNSVVFVVSADGDVNDRVKKECIQMCEEKKICIYLPNCKGDEDTLIYKFWKKTKYSQALEKSRDMQSVVNTYSDVLMLAHSNLNGLRISTFRSKNNGSKIENEHCIVLYCTGKGIIPLTEGPFPKKLGKYGVDVRERSFDFCSPDLHMGLSIGTEPSENIGTLGPFVEDAEGEKKYCGFITCGHVCLDYSTLFEARDKKRTCKSLRKSPIINQPPSNGYAKDRVRDIRCGKLHSIYFGNIDVHGVGYGVDVAHIRITMERIAQEPSLFNFAPNLPLPIGDKYVKEMEEKDKGANVHKWGSGTGHTVGEYSGKVTIKCPNKSHPFDRQDITLKNMYTVESDNPICDSGDSGSAVYLERDGEFCLMGILVACASGYTSYHVSPVTAILKALEHLSIKKREYRVSTLQSRHNTSGYKKLYTMRAGEKKSEDISTVLGNGSKILLIGDGYENCTKTQIVEKFIQKGKCDIACLVLKCDKDNKLTPESQEVSKLRLPCQMYWTSGDTTSAKSICKQLK